MKQQLLILFLLISVLFKTLDSYAFEVAKYPFNLTRSSVFFEGEKDSIWPKKQYEFYDDYSNMLGLFLYAKQKYSRFSIVDKSTDKELMYSPNKQLNMGFGFNYKWLGIGIAFNLGFINNDDDKYGRTKRLDWQTNVYTNKAVFDFYLQNYRGHYVENPDEVFSGWKSGDAPYIRSDVVTISLGLSGMYVFNHNQFSYKAAFMQTAVQKKSAGSFILGASVFTQAIVGDSSIFPKGSDFDSLPPVRAHSAIYFGPKAAYAYNLIVAKHFFASISLSMALEVGKVEDLLEDNTLYSSWNPIIHFQPRVAIGYNKPKWYVGFSLVRDSYIEGSNEEDEDFDFTFKSGNYRIFMGMRFSWFSKKQLMD